MIHKVKILSTGFITHNVKSFIVEKPKKFKFKPGQAVEVAINKKDLKNESRPFTFTSLKDDLVLEFTIKKYDDHDGVTKKLHELKPGEELLLGEVFGTINYKDKGVFIAGGAGITPFIAIFRELHTKNELEENKLIFSNKTSKDIILEKELREYFKPEDLILITTEEENSGYENRKIDKKFLEEKIDNFKQNFYLCGPPAMIEDMKKYLGKLGADISEVVFEK